MNTPDPRLEADLHRVREALDASMQGLDGATASRLTRARHAALAHLPERRVAWRRPAMVAAGAMAALVLAVRPAPPPTAPVPSETFAMLASEKDRELLSEMEFYLWLVEETDDES